jgi:hypothetical protein
MSSRVGPTIVKLLIACFLVGMLLRLIGFTPLNLIQHFGETVRRLYDFGVSLLHSAVSTVEWAVPYILLGAIVVVPIWLFRTGWQGFRGRRQ